MTQTCETSTLPTPTPARRRAATALPVLIEIPNLAAPTRVPRHRGRRRRLRREIRVAGYVFLTIFPLSLAIVSFGGDRLPPLAARSLTVIRSSASAPNLNPTRNAPKISLAPLEPIERDLDAPVFLPGYLLPADTPEDTSHGGH